MASSSSQVTSNQTSLIPVSGRRWPAEWEPQEAIWLSWPHRLATWPNHFAGVREEFTEFVRAIASVVKAQVLVAPSAMESARDALAEIENVVLHSCPTNDTWIRDFGPTFVWQDGQSVGVDWRFNAWGGKYPPWDSDAAAAAWICDKIGIRREESELTCEGGALETDGCGRLLTTPECLITNTRNPGWSQEQIAHELHQRLGIHEILWLDGGGLLGDDTDGHIDQLARFINPANVVCAVSDSSDDPNHEGLESNYRQLRVWGRDTEPGVEIHRLPTPPPRFVDGVRVPESYCNFLIVGGRRLILPQFGHARSDRRAERYLRLLMPQMEIVALPAIKFIWGRGAFHCASQQQPSPAISVES